MQNSDEIYAFRDREIHVWLAFPGEIGDPGLLSAYRELLSYQELAQCERFYFPRDSHTYLVSRALLRSILSGYTDIPPKRLEFPRNDYGRPELQAFSERIPWISFNVSHTRGLVLCGVVPHQGIGADVEFNARERNFSGISTRFFSGREVEDLSSLQQTEMRYRFFQYWTLKESYIKALGKGLHIPLQQFDFQISEGSTVGISFQTRVGEDDKQWQFFLFHPGEEYTAAIAVSRGINEDYRLSFRRVIPLQDITTCFFPYITSGK